MRRRVCLRSIPPLQYRRLSPGADNQTQSCILRVFGKRGCPNSPLRSTDETMARVLNGFLDYAAQFPDVRFVAAEELFR